MSFIAKKNTVPCQLIWRIVTSCFF